MALRGWQSKVVEPAHAEKAQKRTKKGRKDWPLRMVSTEKGGSPRKQFCRGKMETKPSVNRGQGGARTSHNEQKRHISFCFYVPKRCRTLLRPRAARTPQRINTDRSGLAARCEARATSILTTIEPCSGLTSFIFYLIKDERSQTI